MLEAISDFWKPAKKGQTTEQLHPEQLQIGSIIGFGFVPQASLSGRRLQVAEINTYQFGDEALTSFVLSHEKEPVASMIVAESDGEQYLALSRRMTIGERMKMFDSRDLENVMDKPEVMQLKCVDNVPEFKGWVVSSYKREIQGLKGRIYKGDFRKVQLPQASDTQEFKYTLLVSDSNEHAIEIEAYQDGRVEVYATIYRRMSDVGEISYPGRGELSRPDLKLASKTGDAPVPVASKPMLASAPVKQESPSPVKSEAMSLSDFAASPVAAQLRETTAAKNPPQEIKAETKTEIKPQEPVKTEEKKPMPMQEPAFNGSMHNEMKPKVASVMVQPTAPESYMKQEVKAVSKQINGMDNDAVECDLRVANKIIDEAIRNEMRLSDIVRRIIELPVAYPEAVQIPITLSDDDFALLAIRYGISSSDRNGIKRRIIEDLNDFSGNKKAA